MAAVEVKDKRPPENAPAEAGAAHVLETHEQKKERKREESRKRKQTEQTWLEGNVATTGRLRGRPSLYVHPSWELTEHERSRFDRVHGVAGMFEQIRHKVHHDDRDLVINALAGTVGFHELSKVIDSLESDRYDSMDDLQSDLERIRVGFELAMQALDKILHGRGIALDARSKGGKSKSEPAWWDDCANAAMRLLESGSAPHELAGKLAARFQHSEKAIRTVLKKKGVK